MPRVIAAACNRPTLGTPRIWISIFFIMFPVTLSHEIVVGTAVLPLLDDRCINMVSMSMSPGVITQDSMVQQMTDNCVRGMANFNKTETTVSKTINGTNYTFTYTSSITAESMSTVRLLCRVNSIRFTTNIVYWYIIPDGSEGERISSDGIKDGDGKFPRMDPKFDPKNGIFDLIIYNVTVNDTSTYKCFFNLEDSVDLKPKLIVNKTGLIKIRKISSQKTKQGYAETTKSTGTPSTFSYSPGEFAQLECETDQIRGDPYYHVGWGREMIPIRSYGGNSSFVPGKTLVFRKLEYNDAGRYYCETRNSFGRDYLMIEIGVE